MRRGPGMFDSRGAAGESGGHEIRSGTQRHIGQDRRTHRSCREGCRDRSSGPGSDFGGAVMPVGMEDASKLPRITEALLKRGYTEPDIIKILGGNLLHVMGQVEATKSQ